jgi:proteasome lid subunit RPN8/RPN11
MSLILDSEHVTAMRERGRASYPRECCGALLGFADPRYPHDKRVVEVLSAGNERDDAPERRFLISAEEVRRLEREARARGLSIMGFYHSHPDHPARPSDYDREHAWPWYSYVILEVRGGRDGAIRSWRLSEDRVRFEEETIEETIQERA